ncbi:MAG: sigma-E processing peptidase SpoIIGA [Tepidibacter sp.]|jgi:stage II sporulation protein GA (sporulation sigma-E factor processing peptidase)|uniref:sigma-E processing peptidase SpoIIGA n=1 Tax=Tepidibacter sp. TaxID=2529387 RepID=UPI0025FEAF3A|nr:sigma-E processing peptidase SpoIIGA [Tepidibacter sp.]MCT4508529.1 sigma-E processing peptidase SpoIIGA [Tepidibacter sp.]
MIVYAEYYFLHNLLANYMVLKTTSRIVNNNFSRYRAFIGGFIGALYCMIYFIPSLKFLYNILMKIIFALFIVFISFEYKGVKEYLKLLMVFYIVNIFLAGSIFYIVYCSGINYMPVSLVLIYATYFMASSSLFNRFYKIIKNLNIFKDLKNDITVKIQDKQVVFNTLMDTGNLLKDPVSQNPVMIVDVRKLEDVLPKELIYIDYSIMDFKKVDYLMSKLSDAISSRFRVIPYKVVGNEDGLLIGIKADYIEIQGHKKGNIILGLSNLGSDDMNEYDAIINPNFI